MSHALKWVDLPRIELGSRPVPRAAFDGQSKPSKPSRSKCHLVVCHAERGQCGGGLGFQCIFFSVADAELARHLH